MSTMSGPPDPHQPDDPHRAEPPPVYQVPPSSPASPGSGPAAYPPPAPPGSYATQHYGPPPGAPIQQGYGASAPSPEERNWALAAHIGSLVAAWFAMGFLCPLVVLLVKGKESAFVRRHAVESLNFQITLLIYLVVSVILAFVLIGFFLLAAVAILALVTIILATMKASEGQDYRYPLCLRMVS
jgi:uncharacterized Tic20 family protein